jgi:hypothetical protein
MHLNISLDDFNNALDKAIMDNNVKEIEHLISYFENHVEEITNHMTMRIRDESGNEFKRLKV